MVLFFRSWEKMGKRKSIINRKIMLYFLYSFFNKIKVREFVLKKVVYIKGVMLKSKM